MLLAVLVLVLQDLSGIQDIPERPSLVRKFTVHGVTAEGLDVAPDGNVIIAVAGTLQRMTPDGHSLGQIAVGSGYVLEPRVSPDGRRLAYISTARSEGGPADTFVLWVSDLDGQNARQVTSVDVRMIAWKSDSQGLTAVLSDPSAETALVDIALTGEVTDLGMPAPGGSGCCLGGRTLVSTGSAIVLLGEDGEPPEALLRSDAYLSRPTISPDQSALAYLRIDGSRSMLVRRDLATGSETPIGEWTTPTEPYRRVFHERELSGGVAFAFLPNSNILIWEGDGGVWTGGGGRPRQAPLSFDVSREARQPFFPPPVAIGETVRLRQLRWPTGRPDGDQVVVTAAGKLWRIAPGAPSVRVTDSDDFELFPTFSPDGRSLAYVGVPKAGQAELRLRDLASGAEVVLQRSPIVAHPRFSPDGTSIAYFASDASYEAIRGVRKSGSLALTTIRLDDRRSRALRHLDFLRWPSDEYYPSISWSQDGRISVLEETSAAPDAVSGFVLTSIDPETGAARVAAQAGQGVNTWVVSPSGRLAARSSQQSLVITDLSNGATVARLEGASVQSLSWVGETEVRFLNGNIERRWRIGDAAAHSERELVIDVARSHGKGVVALTHATVISMGPQGDLDDAVVIIRDGRIEAVGPSADTRVPPDATVMDLSGRFVLPGLIDTHTHYHLAWDPDFPSTRDLYRASLAFGVTTLFDPSAYSAMVFANAEMIETGGVQGPRLFSTGLPLSRESDSASGRAIHSALDAAAFVEMRREQGAILIKSYYLPRQQRRWLVDAAAAAGIAVTQEGITDTDSMVLNLFEDGVASLEHAPRIDGPDDLLRFEASTGVYVTPTLMVGLDEAAIRAAFTGRFAGDPRLGLVRGFDRIMDFDPPVNGQASERIVTAEDAARLDRLGTLVTVGAHGTPMDTHMELWAFGRGGMPAHRALAAATINGARKIGVEADLGSVEAGKFADLLVLNRDPREDLTATLDAAYVVSRGAVYDPRTLEPVNARALQIPEASTGGDPT